MSIAGTRPVRRDREMTVFPLAAFPFASAPEWYVPCSVSRY